MIDIKTVLCPVDFSPITKRVVELGIEVCRLFGAGRLVLHHNIEEWPPIDIPPQQYLYLVDCQAREAERLLRDTMARIPSAIRAESKTTRGQTHNSILELARELPADIIVMGTHGRSGVNHLLLGSTTERVIARSPCPVLTARDTGNDTLFASQVEVAAKATAQVLVPIDFSPHSIYTLEQAYGMMDWVPITLNLLHVVAPISWDDMRGATHFNVPEFQRHRILEARKRLRSMIPSEFVGRVHAHACMGPVAKEITSYADRIQARLIVMGVVRKGIMGKLLFGATAYDVLRTSLCPVWIVPELGSSRAEEEAEAEFAAFPYPSPQ